MNVIVYLILCVNLRCNNKLTMIAAVFNAIKDYLLPCMNSIDSDKHAHFAGTVLV